VNDEMMTFALLLNTLFILGGVIVIVMAMHQRTRKIEMQHRERMAMIDRGLTPSPETNPEQFEASLGRPGVSRYTSLGIAIVGLGMGLMLLIGVAGDAPGAGVGVGGAIVVLGAAFIVNGYLQRGTQPPPPPGTPYARPVTPQLPRSDSAGPHGPVAE
jgi:hypothetical protein